MLPPESIAATLLAERLPLTAYFASVTRDFHLAEDVFQEISVKAVGRAAEFESPAHVLNWSRVAGRNRSIDLLRARGGRYVGLSEAMLATLAAEWPDQTEASPMHEALRFCLGSITPNNRERCGCATSSSATAPRSRRSWARRSRAFIRPSPGFTGLWANA